MFTKMFFITAAFLISVLIVSPTYPSVIIDHTCTDISQIPSYWINQAKARFKISYGHSSHGEQIVTGMTLLKDQYGVLYDFSYSGGSGVLSLHDTEPYGDLGAPDRVTWAQETRDLLNTPGNDRNMIMWAWCGQVSTATEADINTYLNLMNQLEIDYPDVTFIYMTGHLDGNGETGNLNIRNNQIRDYCEAHNKVLFDFADIESYDPDGNYFLDRWADDGCNYYGSDGGNWADEWCAANPGECASCECAHSRCLNCQLKGKAFWYMMARLAGWDSDASTSITTTIDFPTSSTTTSIQTTTSPTSTITTTTAAVTTTTSVETDCSIALEPETTSTHSKESLTFTVTEVGNCNEPDYEWSIKSDIDSSIDQSGKYSAGLNPHTFKAAIDLVRVVDHENDSIAAEAEVTVLTCPLSVLYGSDSEEVKLLRYFRDNVLTRTPEGRELIKIYYQWAAFIVMAMEQNEFFKEEVRTTIDEMLPLIQKTLQ